MNTSLHTLTVNEIADQIKEINDLAILADNYGNIQQMIQEMEAKAKLINETLKAKMAADERVIGSQWTVLKSQPKESSRLDTKKLEEDLGKDTLAGYYKAVKNSPRLTVDHTKLWETAA
jgi:predicted phage-related endonuclease